MTSVTYFICGVRVEGTTTLEIKLCGDATEPTPALQHLARGGRGETIAGNKGQWIVALETGDHIIRIEHEEYETTWPGVTLSLSPGGILVTSPTKDAFSAWQAELGGSDPKDPWPPPATVQTLSDAQWFQQTFGSLQLVVAKGD